MAQGLLGFRAGMLTRGLLVPSAKGCVSFDQAARATYERVQILFHQLVIQSIQFLCSIPVITANLRLPTTHGMASLMAVRWRGPTGTPHPTMTPSHIWPRCMPRTTSLCQSHRCDGLMAGVVDGDDGGDGGDDDDGDADDDDDTVVVVVI